MPIIAISKTQFGPAQELMPVAYQPEIYAASFIEQHYEAETKRPLSHGWWWYPERNLLVHES